MSAAEDAAQRESRSRSFEVRRCAENRSRSCRRATKRAREVARPRSAGCSARRNARRSSAQQTRIQESSAQLPARDRALALASAEAQHLEGRLASYLEALQSYEGQRGVFSAEIVGLDARNRGARGAAYFRPNASSTRRPTQIRDLSGDLAVREQARRVARARSECARRGARPAQRAARERGAGAAEAPLDRRRSHRDPGARSERVSALEGDVRESKRVFRAAQAEITRLRRERDELQSDLTALEVTVEELEASRRRADGCRCRAPGRARKHGQSLPATRAPKPKNRSRRASRRVSDLTGELTGARRTLEERTAALRTALDERTASLTAQLQEREHALQAEIDARDARAAGAARRSTSTAIEAAQLAGRGATGAPATPPKERVEELENELSRPIRTASRALQEELRVGQRAQAGDRNRPERRRRHDQSAGDRAARQERAAR